MSKCLRMAIVFILLAVVGGILLAQTRVGNYEMILLYSRAIPMMGCGQELLKQVSTWEDFTVEASASASAHEAELAYVEGDSEVVAKLALDIRTKLYRGVYYRTNPDGDLSMQIYYMPFPTDYAFNHFSYPPGVLRGVMEMHLSVDCMIEVTYEMDRL